jgi:hypothetical protein
MKRFGLFIIVVLTVSAVALPLAYFSNENRETIVKEGEFFFGVTYGQNTVEEAKLLIDRVQSYTNVFVVDSFDISNNKTALDSVCTYAAEKNLHFIVYFFSLYASDWQREWVITARQTWSDKFLGVYLRDEPGGRQIELAEIVPNASSYSDAAEKYIQAVSSSWSMLFLKDEAIPVVTSDFALYWFDYQAGFDVIFAELGWNNSRTQEIALCRGAATAQGKDWGAIITWTYQHPPYLESGLETYLDMVTAYEAGAKYILLFNYPQYPQTNQYGILTDEHFTAMQQFWNYANAHPRDLAKTRGEAALVLPEDYGWGMRSVNDTIWGLWPADNSSALIWQNLNALMDRYGLKLDVIYEDNAFDSAKYYSKVYLWNETIR